MVASRAPSITSNQIVRVARGDGNVQRVALLLLAHDEVAVDRIATSRNRPPSPS